MACPHHCGLAMLNAGSSIHSPKLSHDMSYDSGLEVVKLPHARINFVWITDLHMSAIPPGRRGDDYAEAIFDKLRFVRDLTEKLNGICLIGGDVFHNKHPKSPGNSLGLIEESIHLFSSFPFGRVWGAIGNHDLLNDRLDSLPSQPLGI